MQRTAETSLARLVTFYALSHIPPCVLASMSDPMSMRTVDRGEIAIYQRALEVRLEQESVWLSLNQIAAMFECDKSAISRHLRNVYATAELDRTATVAFFATTAADQGQGARDSRCAGFVARNLMK
jgi:hypothetical protein